MLLHALLLSKLYKHQIKQNLKKMIEMFRKKKNSACYRVVHYILYILFAFESVTVLGSFL